MLSEQDIDLEEVFGYLDRNALFAGQWQMRKSKDQSRESMSNNSAIRLSRCCRSGCNGPAARSC